MNAPLVVGIFVGGQGSRMGGVAKGLLRAPASELTLVERLSREVSAAATDAELVLVGDGPTYASLGMPVVADAPSGIGPLGGLLGLLEHAQARGAKQLLALACDLPRLDRALIERLLTEAPDVGALVVHHAGVRNPLIARYAVVTALHAARAVHESGKRSLQAVLDALNAAVLSIESDSNVADDWDTLSDVTR